MGLVFAVTLGGSLKLMKKSFYIGCEAVGDTRRELCAFIGKKVNTDIFGGDVIGVCPYSVTSGGIENGVSRCDPETCLC